MNTGLIIIPTPDPFLKFSVEVAQKSLRCVVAIAGGLCFSQPHDMVLQFFHDVLYPVQFGKGSYPSYTKHSESDGCTIG